METKKKFRYYSIFNYEKEQKFLESQHKAGWKFTKITGIGVFHFEKCEAQDMSYQLDYNAEAQKNQDEYIKMFSDCGWEHITDFAGYSYFRKPTEENNLTEEIFWDNESKLDMMKRVLRGRMLPLLIIFLCALVPLFILNIIRQDFIGVVVIGAVLLLYISIFTTCFVKYLQVKSKT